MYVYRVWIVHDEYTLDANDRNDAVSQGATLYKKKHPSSKFTWSQLFSIGHAKRINW